jgi:hypothetical protein
MPSCLLFKAGKRLGFPPEQDKVSRSLPGASGRIVLWAWSLVFLGLVLRSYHYLRCPSLWCDEAAVILNVEDKSYAGLLGPLRFAEAGSPLFLWAEKGIGSLLGDHVYVWRLLPFLASCASLVLLVPVAFRLLPAATVPWAILLSACSDRILWHSCEAKPYTIDLLCATLLLNAYCWTRTWPILRQILLYSVLAPLLIFLSYPGCFLCGGILLALLPSVLRDRTRATWLAYVFLGMVVAGSFLLLLIGPIRAQKCPDLMFFWEAQLPDWNHPWKVPGWTVGAFFGMFRYCAKPTGGFLGIVAITGAIVFWRQRERSLAVLLTVPILLAMAAAYLRFYPFGHARLELYAAPAVVLLVAAGLPSWHRRLASCAPPAPVLLAALLLAPVALTAYRLAVHWDRPDSNLATEYVLTHRLPDDPVRATHWEHEYFFRPLGPLFSLGVSSPQNAERLWVVSEGPTEAVRLTNVQNNLAKDWTIVECHADFAQTTVVLLTKRAR